jgi:hypothetical protein
VAGLPAVAEVATGSMDTTGPADATQPRDERPGRTEGERGGRRSRRGGRRRRRDSSEFNAGAAGADAAQSPASTTEERPPAPQSFDFDRPAVAAAEPRPDWTPTPPSDATREGPRSEP